MPATVLSAGTTPNLIQVGPGLLWTNVDQPGASTVYPVSGHAATHVQDQRVYGPAPVSVSGTFIGSTIGDSTCSYRTNFVDILIETSTAKVEKVLDTEEAYCGFNVAELTAENLQRTLPGGNTGDPIATLATSADAYQAGQTAHFLTVGGLRLVEPMTILLISPNRRVALASGPFSYVFCGYQAVSVEGFDAPFARGRETVWRTNFECIADTRRNIGDQLFQFAVRQAT